MYHGTPPQPGTDAYGAQVDQIRTMVGDAADNMEEAERLVVMLFIVDMSYHRGAISQALREIERDMKARWG